MDQINRAATQSSALGPWGLGVLKTRVAADVSKGTSQLKPCSAIGSVGSGAAGADRVGEPDPGEPSSGLPANLGSSKLSKPFCFLLYGKKTQFEQTVLAPEK